MNSLDFISSNIRSLKPYVPGKPIEEVKREFNLDYVCKLASNENPLGTNPNIIKGLEAELSDVFRYPDASGYLAKKSLAKKFDLDEKYFCLGNGSNELIDLAIRVFCEPKKDSILISENSFIAYKICAQAADVNVIATNMPEDSLSIDAQSILKNLNGDHSHRLIFLANPNNPTGTHLGVGAVEDILKKIEASNTFLVLDEAYNEFVRATDYPDSISLLKKYKNLIVLRTMGKVYGLAGLRVGFAIADPSIISIFDRVRNPFNVNFLAQKAVDIALNDLSYLERSQNAVWQGLDFFYSKLKDLGLEYWESQANFVLFKAPLPGHEFCKKLMELGLVLRPLAKEGPFKFFVRMSVGNPEENKFAMLSIEKVIKSLSD